MERKSAEEIKNFIETNYYGKTETEETSVEGVEVQEDDVPYEAPAPKVPVKTQPATPVKPATTAPSPAKAENTDNGHDDKVMALINGLDELN